MKRTSFLRSALGIAAVVVTATAVIHGAGGSQATAAVRARR